MFCFCSYVFLLPFVFFILLIYLLIQKGWSLIQSIIYYIFTLKFTAKKRLCIYYFTFEYILKCFLRYMAITMDFPLYIACRWTSLKIKILFDVNNYFLCSHFSPQSPENLVTRSYTNMRYLLPVVTCYYPL